MTDPVPAKQITPGLRLTLDFGPVLVFFVVNFATNIYVATGAFMVAMGVALIVSKLKAGAISPMLWFSAVMVLIFGGITILLHNETFIKIKPTIYYVFIAGILGFGLWTKRPTLELVLGQAYPGLSTRGWNLLSRNWAGFFLVMAVLNEAVWRNSSTDFWVGFKLWGVLPATFLFAMLNIPMLLRHGLEMEKDKAPPIPKTGE
ncbi:MAG: septation protein A [Sphingomonadaceae bacterium]|nr:septation protein A [Sphingomonadaceae bacterium]